MQKKSTSKTSLYSERNGMEAAVVLLTDESKCGPRFGVEPGSPSNRNDNEINVFNFPVELKAYVERRPPHWSFGFSGPTGISGNKEGNWGK